jgi:hypothetical protein
MLHQVLLWFVIAGRTGIGAWRGDLLIAPCLSGMQVEPCHGDDTTTTAPDKASMTESGSLSDNGLP